MRTKWTVLLWMLMISGLLAAQNTANTSFQVKGILFSTHSPRRVNLMLPLKS